MLMGRGKPETMGLQCRRRIRECLNDEVRGSERGGRNQKNNSLSSQMREKIGGSARDRERHCSERSCAYTGRWLQRKKRKGNAGRYPAAVKDADKKEKGRELTQLCLARNMRNIKKRSRKYRSGKVGPTARVGGMTTLYFLKCGCNQIPHERGISTVRNNLGRGRNNSLWLDGVSQVKDDRRVRIPGMQVERRERVGAREAAGKKRLPP